MDTKRRETVKYALVLLASLLWFVSPAPEQWGLVVVNVVAVVAAAFSMRWRRRHPVLIAVAMNVLFPVFPSLWPMASWAYLSLCTHRRWPATLGVGVVAVVASVVETYNANKLSVTIESPNQPVDVSKGMLLIAAIAFAVLTNGLLAAIGSYVGARRQEAKAMAERIAYAERERDLVERESRAQERNRIAREMHDVLAHKLTLVSMHAGALAYRDDLSREETKAAAQTIQESSRQALAELRLILGQLRQMEDGVVAAPMPTLEDVTSLVQEHRAAGSTVRLASDLDGEPSSTVSRQAYRVVQECLTNAAKHAPGVPVDVAISGNAVDGLSLRVANKLNLFQHRAEGSRLGLIGLDERVETVGGTFHSGESDAGEFVVEVWMPW